MRRTCCLVAALALAACGKPPAPTSPPATSTAAIASLDIRGLPNPLLLDIPPSVAAGRAYPLETVATRSDGTTVGVKPSELAWSSTDPSIVTVSNGVLTGHRPGSATITATLRGVSVTRELTVHAVGQIVREERAENVSCQRECRYPFCPEAGPFWLFPVHEGGTIELVSANNPGWGSPSNYVTQLSPSGGYIKSWLLLPTNQQYRTATVPGGYMYVFTMSANLGPCGNVSAVWTHPQ